MVLLLMVLVEKLRYQVNKNVYMGRNLAIFRLRYITSLTVITKTIPLLSKLEMALHVTRLSEDLFPGKYCPGQIRGIEAMNTLDPQRTLQSLRAKVWQERRRHILALPHVSLLCLLFFSSFLFTLMAPLRHKNLQPIYRRLRRVGGGCQRS
jgi:hypothetical protein